MSVTADDVAKTFNEAGIDTPQKLAAFVGRTDALNRRAVAEASIAKARADASAAAQAVEATVQALAQEKATADADLAKTIR